ERRGAEVDQEEQRDEPGAARQPAEAVPERVTHRRQPTTVCSSRRCCSQNIQRAAHFVAALRAAPFSSTHELLAGFTSSMILRSGSTTARTTFAPGYLKRVQRYWPSHVSCAKRPSENSTMISTGNRTSPSLRTVTSESKASWPGFSSGAFAPGPSGRRGLPRTLRGAAACRCAPRRR